MILTQSQIDKAMDWVDSGGFLIVGVGDEIQGNASILERFDIDPIEYTDSNDNYLIEDGEFKPLSQRLRELNEEIDERNENGEPAEEEVSFDQGYHFECQAKEVGSGLQEDMVERRLSACCDLRAIYGKDR